MVTLGKLTISIDTASFKFLWPLNMKLSTELSVSLFISGKEEATEESLFSGECCCILFFLIVSLMHVMLGVLVLLDVELLRMVLVSVGPSL